MTNETIPDTTKIRNPGIARLIGILAAVDDSQTSACGFDMTRSAESRQSSNHPCGTACCIGGHAALEFKEPLIYPEYAVVAMCDISDGDAYKICYPCGEDNPGWDAKMHQAIALLRHYDATGIVDWNRAMGVME